MSSCFNGLDTFFTDLAYYGLGYTYVEYIKLYLKTCFGMFCLHDAPSMSFNWKLDSLGIFFSELDLLSITRL